jgi:hypothetical protein
VIDGGLREADDHALTILSVSTNHQRRLQGVVSSALELAGPDDHPLSDVRRAVIAAEVRRSREAQRLPVKITDPDTLRRIASMIRRAARSRGDAPANGRGRVKPAA